MRRRVSATTSLQDCVMKIIIQSICIHHEDIEMSDYLMRGLGEIKRVLTLDAKELSLNNRQYYISVINEAMDLIRFYDLNVKRMEDRVKDE